MGLQLARNVPIVAGIVLACSSALAQTNPAARPTRDISVLNGVWNGAHLEQRSNCMTPENNGGHGTYSQYIFSLNAPGHGLALAEAAIQGLNCTWDGTFDQQDGHWTWGGTLSCSDGRTGTFQSENIFANMSVMTIHLAIHLTGSESCTVDAVISGARL